MTGNDTPPQRPFPWRDAMALGLGVLRLSPGAFWSMTPRELQAALDGLCGRSAGLTPPNREELAELIRQFPDEAGT